jgi:hypothetical protein
MLITYRLIDSKADLLADADTMIPQGLSPRSHPANKIWKLANALESLADLPVRNPYLSSQESNRCRCCLVTQHCFGYFKLSLY